jgi:hypothetical protein
VRVCAAGVQPSSASERLASGKELGVKLDGLLLKSNLNYDLRYFFFITFADVFKDIIRKITEVKFSDITTVKNSIWPLKQNPIFQ